jgi:glycolate oxidase
MKDRNLIKDLGEIAGEENVSQSIFVRANYATTPLAIHLSQEDLPEAVVRPRDAEQVSRFLRYANDHRIPITIHGSGSSLIGASRPKRRGIVINMSRLNSFEINEDYDWFECGAGAICLEAKEKLLKKGYLLPLNPGSAPIASMGGLISGNTVGHFVDGAVGRALHYVLGLEVVLPTGEIIETGSRSVRRVVGLDLTRIFCGGEGLFGVITKICMLLIPDPQKAHLVAFFERDEDVIAPFLRMHRERAPIPLYAEFLGRECVQVAIKEKGLQLTDGAMALTTSIGRERDEATRNARALLEIFKGEGAKEAYLIEDEETREGMWAARDFIQYLDPKGAGNVILEISPALPHLPDVIPALKEAQMRSDLLRTSRLYIFGHIGSPAVHGFFAFPPGLSAEEKRERVKEGFRVEKDLNLRFEGCVGEWGQTSIRVPYLREKYGEKTYEVFKALKRTFDPNNILNPGNLEGEI